MRKGTKHNPDSIQKMKRPKSDEARAHMRQPKPETMKAKLRVPHSAERKAAISKGMQESPKLKPKREQARDVIIKGGKLIFKKPEPPIPYQDRVARRDMFDAYIDNLVHRRMDRTEGENVDRIKRDDGWFYGQRFDKAKVKKAYEDRIRSGLRDGTLIRDGEYIYEK